MTALLDKVDAIQTALAGFRFEAKRKGRFAFDTADYRDLLDAFYQLSEIDAVWNAARDLDREESPSRDMRPMASHEYCRVGRA